ncbi:MAG: type II toxin-antitoxin system VapC family toxin [Planctomycetota bacterium]
MSTGALLDTNVLIDYLRNISSAADYLENAEGPLSISAISVAELRAGARDRKERLALKEFISLFDVIPADAEICELAGDFRSQYGPSHGLDLIDGIIAATSHLRHLPLVTLNKRHFPMLSSVIVPYRRE